MFTMRVIPSAYARGWTVRVDGVDQPAVGIIEITSKFGTLTYGLRPEGYDSWSFREAGGGGAVTLLWSRAPNGELLIGLMREMRANMGDDPVWCVIGGFLNPGETHQQAQIREAGEEAGVNSLHAGELAGPSINWNRAFLEADARLEGVKAYERFVEFGQLNPDGAAWSLKNTSLLPNFRKRSEVRFFPWRVAIGKTADALALSAIAKLLNQELK